MKGIMKAKDILAKLFLSKVYEAGLIGYGMNDDYLSQNQVKAMERKIAFAKISALTNTIPGDYLEFGVFRGDSMVLAYHTIGCLAQDNVCRFIGFDSFEGLPEITVKSDHADGWRKGDMKSDYDMVERRLADIMDKSRFSLVKGFFNTTLNEKTKKRLNITRAKVIMIDSDIYSSAKEALEFCKTIVGPGTVIILDNYYYSQGDPLKGGEAKAFDEFMKDVPFIAHQYCSFGFGGQSFILHISEKKK